MPEDERINATRPRASQPAAGVLSCTREAGGTTVGSSTARRRLRFHRRQEVFSVIAMASEENTDALSVEKPTTKIPPDVIEKILLRLPIRSSLRLRRVYK
ncbi:unnamed protein product [Urochloa humidicola]